jgi:hypothetical protein
MFAPNTHTSGVVVLWSIAIATSLAIGVAPHAITPEAELFGPCAPGSGAPFTQAQTSAGTITGLNSVVPAGDVTGISPLPSGCPSRSSCCPISGPIPTITPVPASEARLFGLHAPAGAPTPQGFSHAAAPAQSALDVHGLPASAPLAQEFAATASERT